MGNWVQLVISGPKYTVMHVTKGGRPVGSLLSATSLMPLALYNMQCTYSSNITNSGKAYTIIYTLKCNTHKVHADRDLSPDTVYFMRTHIDTCGCCQLTISTLSSR